MFSVECRKAGFSVRLNERAHISVPIIPSLTPMDKISLDVPMISSHHPLFKIEKITKQFTFPAFDFVPPVNDIPLARGDSLEHGSALTALNSPQIINKPFKKQNWMSDEYLDSIYSLPLGAHANKGTTDLVTVSNY